MCALSPNCPAGRFTVRHQVRGELAQCRRSGVTSGSWPRPWSGEPIRMICAPSVLDRSHSAVPSAVPVAHNAIDLGYGDQDQVAVSDLAEWAI
jgi:hypothetical protein